MPHFCKCGADEYICQECGKINCSKEQPSKWVHIPRMNREGNMCQKCFDEYESFHGLYAGKSEIVEKVAEKHGLPLIKLKLSE